MSALRFHCAWPLGVFYHVIKGQVLLHVFPKFWSALENWQLVIFPPRYQPPQLCLGLCHCLSAPEWHTANFFLSGIWVLYGDPRVITRTTNPKPRHWPLAP